ncbi:MAG: hypothetical protein ACE5I1_27320, partial [bacterium]
MGKMGSERRNKVITCKGKAEIAHRHLPELPIGIQGLEAQFHTNSDCHGKSDGEAHASVFPD